MMSYTTKGTLQGPVRGPLYALVISIITVQSSRGSVKIKISYLQIYIDLPFACILAFFGLSTQVVIT